MVCAENVQMSIPARLRGTIQEGTFVPLCTLELETAGDFHKCAKRTDPSPTTFEISLFCSRAETVFCQHLIASSLKWPQAQIGKKCTHLQRSDNVLMLDGQPEWRTLTCQSFFRLR